MTRTVYRYRDGRMIGPDGMPMLNQGERAAEPCAPFTISDTQQALKSMTNGKLYDSKSEMRKEYRRAGVAEVGNDKQQNGRSWSEERAYRAKQREKIKGALYRVHSQKGDGAP